MDRIKSALKRDIWILLLDIVAVNLAYYLALAFRVAVNNMGGIFGSPSDVPVYFSAFYRIAPIYTVLCIVVFFLFKLYGGVWRFAGINDMYRILASWVVTTVIQILVSYLMMKAIGFNTSRMPATYYMLGCMLQLLFVTAIRFGPKTVADEKRKRAKKADKALVVGAGELGQQTVKMLQSGMNYEVSAIVDTENEHVGLMIDGTPVYGLESLEALTENNAIKCVFLAEPDLNTKNKGRIAACCKAKNVELKERMFDSASKNEPVSEQQFKAVIIVGLCDLKNEIYLLYDGTKPIATFMTKRNEDELHFEKLGTLPSESGKGIGSYCMSKIEEMAKDASCKKVII